MASASTTGDESDSEAWIEEEDDETPSSIDEGEEWINNEYFSVEDIQTEIKAQYKKAMKKPISEDLVHKKLSSFFIDNIKLHMMQLVGLHFDMNTIKDIVEN